MALDALQGKVGAIGAILRTPLALVGPPLIILVSSSVELLSRNAEYFDAGLATILPFLLAACAYLAIGTIAFRLRNASKVFESTFFAYLLSAPLWILYSATVEVAGKNAFLGLVLLAAMGGAYLAHARRLAAPLVTALSLFSFAMLAMTALNALQIRSADAIAQGTEHGGFEATNRAGVAGQAAILPDIYHVVLDEFQTDMFRAVLDDDLRKKLRGVVWFPNASTPFGRTEMALASVFAGVPYDYREPPAEYIRNAFASEQSMLTQLKLLGYETIGFLHQVYPRGSQSRFDHAYFHKELKRTAGSPEQRALFASLWLHAYLPEFVTQRVLPEHHLEQLASQALLPDDSRFVSLLSFRRLLEWEGKAARKGARYIFVHLILPHFPNVLAADCSYQPGRGTSVVEQTSCAARQIAEFLEFLEGHGRFEDALILVHADHGSRYLYEGGQLRRAQGGIYELDRSWARSRPLVLVKPAGIDRTRGFLVDERATDLLDLFPTVFANLGKSPPVRLAGSSLLADPVPGRPRHYHFYDKDRTRVVDGTLKRYTILRSGEIAFDTEILPFQRE